jgi:GTPase SAR1 family protein
MKTRVREWIQEVREHAMDDVAIALVGNKNDLQQKKKVSTGEAKVK